MVSGCAAVSAKAGVEAAPRAPNTVAEASAAALAILVSRTLNMEFPSGRHDLALMVERIVCLCDNPYNNLYCKQSLQISQRRKKPPCLMNYAPFLLSPKQ